MSAFEYLREIELRERANAAKEAADGAVQSATAKHDSDSPCS